MRYLYGGLESSLENLCDERYMPAERQSVDVQRGLIRDFVMFDRGEGGAASDSVLQLRQAYDP